jgi:hypothetical protein
MYRDSASGSKESFMILMPPKQSYDLPRMAHFSSPNSGQQKLAELLEFSFAYFSNADLISDRTVHLHEALIEDALATGRWQPRLS